VVGLPVVWVAMTSLSASGRHPASYSSARLSGLPQHVSGGVGATSLTSTLARDERLQAEKRRGTAKRTLCASSGFSFITESLCDNGTEFSTRLLDAHMGRLTPPEGTHDLCANKSQVLFYVLHIPKAAGSSVEYTLSNVVKDFYFEYNEAGRAFALARMDNARASVFFTQIGNHITYADVMHGIPANPGYMPPQQTPFGTVLDGQPVDLMSYRPGSGSPDTMPQCRPEATWTNVDKGKHVTSRTPRQSPYHNSCDGDLWTRGGANCPRRGDYVCRPTSCVSTSPVFLMPIRAVCTPLVTFFAHPVTRFKSAFFFSFGQTQKTNCGFLECKKGSSVALRYQRGDLTPNQFALWRPKSDIARGFNYASRFFSDERFFRYAEAFDETTQRSTGWNRSEARRYSVNWEPPTSNGELKQAMRRLQSVDFVGLVDKFDESMLLLTRWLGLPSLNLTYIVNARVKTTMPDHFQMDPHAIAEVEADNAMDLVLYRQAQLLYERRRAQILQSEGAHALDAERTCTEPRCKTGALDTTFSAQLERYSGMGTHHLHGCTSLCTVTAASQPPHASKYPLHPTDSLASSGSGWQA